MNKIIQMRTTMKQGDLERLALDKKPQGLKVLSDINYYGDDDQQHTLDILRPENNNEKLPVIFHVHGGGFLGGDKDIYDNYCRRLALYGYVVVNCNYGLTPEHPFPEGILDLVKAMEYVVDRAEEFLLDLTNFNLVGDSAGGNLVVTLGLIGTNSKYADYYQTNLPIDISAIGASCGLYDLQSLNSAEIPFLAMYLQKNEEAIKEELYRIDIFNNLTSSFPRTYLTSCLDDFLYTDNKSLFKVLKKLNVECEALFYENDVESNPLGHVFNYRWIRKDGSLMLEAQETTDKMIEFFRKKIN